MENKRSVLLAVIAGHLLIVAGAVGSAGIWGTLIPLIGSYLTGLEPSLT